jgi:hypothetical protein
LVYLEALVDSNVYDCLHRIAQICARKYASTQVAHIHVIGIGRTTKFLGEVNGCMDDGLAVVGVKHGAVFIQNMCKYIEPNHNQSKLVISTSQHEDPVYEIQQTTSFNPSILRGEVRKNPYDVARKIDNL